MTKHTDSFWQSVKDHLVTNHEMPPQEANEAIQKNRHLTDDEVGDALRHFGPEDMAQGIVEGMKK